MKKLATVALLSILPIVNTFAYECAPGIKKYGEESKQICNMVETVCLWWNTDPKTPSYFDKNNPMLIKYEDYRHFKEVIKEEGKPFNIRDANDVKGPFQELQLTYKTNMANIYDCATGQTKIWALKNVLEEIKNSPEVSAKIEKNIKNEIKQIESSLDNCNFKNKWSFVKEDVLKASTYEMCKYVVNLNYLNESYYSELGSYVSYGHEESLKKLSKEEQEKYKDINKVTFAYTNALSSALSNELFEEIVHTKEVYAKTFNTYKEYENNYTAHAFLELLKADLTVYRDELAGALKPLNQVVYAIINAMSK